LDLSPGQSGLKQKGSSRGGRQEKERKRTAEEANFFAKLFALCVNLHFEKEIN